MSIEKTILTVAVLVLNSIRKDFADYEEACNEWHKQGYRPHYCIHGTNQWTDYDNICGACEEGDNYWNYETCGRRALDIAKAAYKEMNERTDMAVKMYMKGAPVDIAKMGEWIMEPLTKLGYVPEHQR